MKKGSEDNGSEKMEGWRIRGQEDLGRINHLLFFDSAQTV
jgi:hypothetical protein